MNKIVLLVTFRNIAAGAFLCFLGFLSAIIVSILDRWGVRQLGDEDNLKQESKKLVSFS